jgi:hemolysin activation/secretion protein
VRLLAPDTLLVVRGDVQVANEALVPLEQIGLGGQETVRGYRQDFLLTDNGVLASAELRYPVLRVPQINGLLQIAPFFDFGRAWNNSGNQELGTNNIGSVGLGLRWQQGGLGALLEYGIPLFSVPDERRTLQEKGLHFSIIYNQSF